MFDKFIRRPVLAIALSVAIVFMGLLAIYTLPVAQFPEIAPPRVSIFIEFPGSNADVLVKSTLTILERAINGVQGMQYMLSDATSASEASIDIVFEPGTEPAAPGCVFSFFPQAVTTRARTNSRDKFFIFKIGYSVPGFKFSTGKLWKTWE